MPSDHQVIQFFLEEGLNRIRLPRDHSLLNISADGPNILLFAEVNHQAVRCVIDLYGYHSGDMFDPVNLKYVGTAVTEHHAVHFYLDTTTCVGDGDK